MVSFAVIQAAFFDVLFSLGAMSILGIPLSLPTIAPLLMLIGYSVDTDIMLTERVMKRKAGKASERAMWAMHTGLTMTGTTLAAVLAMYVVSSLTSIAVLANISLIIFIGLIGDLLATWLVNAPIVIWLSEKKTRKVI